MSELWNKLIYVAGCPGGGTSAVAGVLQRLGVYMGHVLQRPNSPYEGYEDRYGRVFQQNNGVEGYDHVAFAQWISRRMEGDGPQGAKIFAHGYLIDGDYREQIELVTVHRPWEECVESWMRDGASEGLLRLMVDSRRAVEKLETLYPVTAVSYSQLIEQPYDTITQINKRLVCSFDVDAAVEFITQYQRREPDERKSA